MAAIRANEKLKELFAPMKAVQSDVWTLSSNKEIGQQYESRPDPKLLLKFFMFGNLR